MQRVVLLNRCAVLEVADTVQRNQRRTWGDTQQVRLNIAGNDGPNGAVSACNDEATFVLEKWVECKSGAATSGQRIQSNQADTNNFGSSCTSRLRSIRVNGAPECGSHRRGCKAQLLWGNCSLGGPLRCWIAMRSASWGRELAKGALREIWVTCSHHVITVDAGSLALFDALVKRDAIVRRASLASWALCSRGRDLAVRSRHESCYSLCEFRIR